MKKYSLLCFVSVLVSSSVLAGDWKWDISENSIRLGVAGAEWNINEDFAGTKVILNGQYVFKREPGKISDKKRAEKLSFIIDADLQWGAGKTGLEYSRLTFTTWATQTDIDRKGSKKLNPVRDTLEWGVIQVGYDDPLGIDSYTEISLGRYGRTWMYKNSADSTWTFFGGIKGSVGWAWAESRIGNYGDVSNPFTGFGATLAVVHDRLGTLYTDDRVIAGYTMGSPTGSVTSREARIRFGYLKRFGRCLQLDIFIEKRSFNFADSDLPDVYTKSKRYGGEISCIFGNS